MGFEVSGDTLARTTGCPSGHACLTNGTDRPCKVRYSLFDDSHVIDSADGIHCVYRVVRTNRHACTCPTRKDIYDRHGV